MMSEVPCDLADIVDELIAELGIPDLHKEQARREGHLAFFEDRDIKEALRYWWFAETRHSKYVTLRDTLATADTDLADDEKTWAHFGTNYSTDCVAPDVDGNALMSWKAPDSANAVTVIFDHKNADADTATFILYAYREKGPAEFVCSGSLTAGAQANDDATARYYADTIASFVQRWIQTVAQTDAGGNDGVAKVSFDLCGYSRVLCLFDDISANDNVRAKIAWF
jgi:hypothetical protein